MRPAAHRHTSSKERRCREAALDATLAESFPASDPLSTLPNPDAHDVELDGDDPGAPDPLADKRPEPG